MAVCLLVGDVHATPDELKDCEELVDGIEFSIMSLPVGVAVDYIVFMGDQFHNHAIVNVHVLDFWKRTFLRLQPLCKQIVCLVGNHDLPGNTGSTSVNSISTLDNLCMVVDKSWCIDDMLFVGFQHDHQKFIDICNDHADIETVFCHQTFNGACYENGFPALDGIDLTVLPAGQRYISGHIHTPQAFGPVQYIGAPRWRTLTDARVESRYLYIFETETKMVKPHYLTCNNVRRLWTVDLIPDIEFNYNFALGFNHSKGDLVYVNVIGPRAWIDNLKRATDPLFIYKEFPTDQRTIAVKESEGIDKALMKYVEGSKVSTPADTLKKMVEDRIWKM